MILYQFCLIFLYSGQNLLGGGPKITPFRKISCTQQYSHTTGKTLLKLMILFWYFTCWNKPYLTEHSKGQTEEVKSAVKEFHLCHKVKVRPVTNAGFSRYLLQVKLRPGVGHRFCLFDSVQPCCLVEKQDREI